MVALLAASLAQVARVLDEPRATTPPVAVAPTAAAAAGGLAVLPMGWVANTGQSDPPVRFLAQGLGYGAFLTDTEAVVQLEGAVVRLGFEGAEPPLPRAEEPLPGRVSRFVAPTRTHGRVNAATSAAGARPELWPGIDVTFRGTGSVLERG